MSEISNPELLTQIQEFFLRHYMMCGAWLVVTVLLIGVQARLLLARVKKTNANFAINMVNREDGVFVDVRNADAFLSGHIANSINVTASDIKAGKVNRIEKNKSLPVILVGKDKFDTDTFNSAQALKKQGYEKVFVLDGGILDWSSNNLPLTKK